MTSATVPRFWHLAVDSQNSDRFTEKQPLEASELDSEAKSPVGEESAKPSDSTGFSDDEKSLTF